MLKRFVGSLGVALLVTACGSSSPSGPSSSTPTPAPAATRAAITVTVTPNPILATASGDPNFPNRMDYSVTINETAGVALNINRVVRSYRGAGQTSDFSTGASNPDDLIKSVGTNHIDAKGSLRIGSFGLTYSGPRQITLNVSVEVIDGFGNKITATSGDVNIL